MADSLSVDIGKDKQQINNRLIQFQPPGPHSPHGAVSGGGIGMKGLVFCAFAIMVLTPAQGEEDEKPEPLVDSGNEDKNDLMTCFQCDLGFWDVCYTTKTTCSLGERCFTGRGKAGDLDIKTLGCAKAEECGVETMEQLIANKTIFAITKLCCDTPFCNSAHKHQTTTLFYLAWALLATWHLTEASVSS